MQCLLPRAQENTLPCARETSTPCGLNTRIATLEQEMLQPARRTMSATHRKGSNIYFPVGSTGYFPAHMVEYPHPRPWVVVFHFPYGCPCLGCIFVPMKCLSTWKAEMKTLGHGLSGVLPPFLAIHGSSRPKKGCKFWGARKNVSCFHPSAQRCEPTNFSGVENQPCHLQILHKTLLGSIRWCLTKKFTICETLCTPARATWAVSAIACSHPKMVNCGFGPWCQCLGHIFGL